MSIQNWMSLFHKHPNETCVIVGNGPSLKDVPLDFLKKYPTFGSNRIYLREGFTPTYYICVNPLVRTQYIQDILPLPCVKFLGGGPTIVEDGNIFNLHSVNVPMFSYAPANWIYEGYTVTFVAMQIAYFMGFETVLLVGVDHRYEFDGKPNEGMMMVGDDPNHFDPNYFKGAIWNNPDLEHSEEAYKLALRAYESTGGRIFNLTPCSALNVFETQHLEAW